MSDYRTLQVRSVEGVWHVTLNRPQVRNAMSLLMVQELRAALLQAEQSGQALTHAPADLVAHAAQVFSQAVRGPEGIEGALAFAQKRKPGWAPA